MSGPTERARARLRRLVATALAAGVAACAVGPDYQRPSAPTPPAYKEAEGWKRGEPQHAASDKLWWSIYRDPVLDGLESQIDVANQTLKEFEAAFRQARALVAEARAGYFPSATVDASGERSRQAGSHVGSHRLESRFDLSAGASWELDVWGRIRRTVESNVASAQASSADVAGARLSAQAALATAYLQLRINDEQSRLLEATADAEARTLQITRSRYATGVAARSDVAQAAAQFEGTRAQAINVGVQRAQLEHAIAVLTGRSPAELSIAPTPLKLEPPSVPVGLPSTLLERRPDIAAAERTMAAANAEIGVAIAAYFPAITLSASYGFMGSAIENLLRASNAVWSLGSTLGETVFDGGLRAAQVEAARASYDKSVATYRQTVLAAFQQVEDELATLRILEQQAEVQDRAVKAAEEAERLIINQYEAGTLAYTSVVTAQTTTLADKQTALTILQNRLVASVLVMEALGGGWSADELPTGVELVRAGAGAATKRPTARIEISSPEISGAMFVLE